MGGRWDSRVTPRPTLQGGPTLPSRPPYDTPGRPINSPAVSAPPPPSVSISLALDLTVPVGAASLQNKQQNQYFLRQGRCRVFDDRPGLPPSRPAGPKARSTQPPSPLLPPISDLITSDEQTFIEHIQPVKLHWARGREGRVRRVLSHEE